MNGAATDPADVQAYEQANGPRHRGRKAAITAARSHIIF